MKAWKFESFVFDAIPLASTTCCMEVDRAEEFSPVKNKTGPDSPFTARESMVRLHKEWLREAGINVPDQFNVEISPLFALNRQEIAGKLRGFLQSITKDTYFG
jgi:UDP-N-acetylglucosamine/UDP-N-acetylgalactosamine diphosphorylase